MMLKHYLLLVKCFTFHHTISHLKLVTSYMLQFILNRLLYILELNNILVRCTQYVHSSLSKALQTSSNCPSDSDRKSYF